jgi:carboxylesterase type B
VLLFIHGGGFNAGGANAYVPQDMVDLYCSRGMIVILVEYRLGVAGQ